MESSKFYSMIRLLEDPDRVVYQEVAQTLLHEGEFIIPRLEEAWEKHPNPFIQGKIENIIQENIEKFDKGFAKFNLNLYQIPLDDLNLFYKEGLAAQTCSPNEELLERLHEEFNKNLSYSINSVQRRIEVETPGISLGLSKPVNVENGLESFNINYSSNGVTSTYTFGNKIAQPISIDLTKRILDTLRQRNSRYNKRRDFQDLYKSI